MAYILAPKGVNEMTHPHPEPGMNHALDDIEPAARDAPGERWVADITYIWTAEGRLYLAVNMDLFSRRGQEPGLRTERSGA